MRLPARLRSQLLTALTGMLLAGLVGAEYYRYSLASRADGREAEARRLATAVTDLKTREQKLAADRALMDRLEMSLVDPKQGNLGKQYLEQVLANQRTAAVEIRSVTLGAGGQLGAAARRSLTVQLRGSDATVVAFLQAVETGPAAARIAGLTFSSADRGAGPGAPADQARMTTINIDYYSRTK